MTDTPSSTEQTVGGRTDAVDFLTSQHREVEALWAQLEGAGSNVSTDRARAARQIVRLLSQHDAIETQLLYPELRDVGGDEGKQQSDHSLEEHQMIREMLKEVDRADDLDEDSYSTLARCIAAVNHHVTEEESVMFPLLRRQCSVERLNELGSKMASMMDTVPTHPHPSTPNSKLGATVAGAVTGAMDRMRDAGADRH
jgi:hemerythrin-like domain-containing protein